MNFEKLGSAYAGLQNFLEMFDGYGELKGTISHTKTVLRNLVISF